MAASQPFYAVCDGGLILDSNKFSLLDRPGVAIKLRNFESSISGGYRRINGYTKFGGESATRPTGTDTKILGVFPYALGVVVCAGTNVYYTEDGITWIQVNKDTTHSGVVEGDLAALSTLTRTSQGQASFIHTNGLVGHTANPYGVLYISTGPNKIAHFHIDGTGGSRLFSYTELSTPAAGTWIESHSNHFCVVDSVNEPSKIYYSSPLDFDSFVGVGSGSVNVSDRITGIKSFRESLFIFCENSIWKLLDIGDSTNIRVEPVTGNLGCIDGASIQEIGGDLIFLAPDGFRTIAGTERISDIELSSISKSIQPLLEEVVKFIDNYTISSVVLREKSQYRFFFIDAAGVGNGFAGTLRSDVNGQLGLQWSEIRNYPVQSINGHYDEDGLEVVYQGGPTGYVYLHDTGNSFDGQPISALYKTPDVHLGDLGLRKTLHYMHAAITNEGQTSVDLSVKFDFGSALVTQPAPFTISILTAPATYGTGIYGTSTYGSNNTPLERIPLQGSCTSVSFSFSSTDTNPSYTIQGFHVDVFPSGRK